MAQEKKAARNVGEKKNKRGIIAEIQTAADSKENFS